MEIGEYQNKIPELPNLGIERYENIFKVHSTIKDSIKYYFYNIQNKVIFPTTLKEDVFGDIDTPVRIPWTTLSYNLYGTISLWWILFLINKPKNIFYAEAGGRYRYILPEFVDAILSEIQSRIE